MRMGRGYVTVAAAVIGIGERGRGRRGCTRHVDRRGRGSLVELSGESGFFRSRGLLSSNEIQYATPKPKHSTGRGGGKRERANASNSRLTLLYIFIIKANKRECTLLGREGRGGFQEWEGVKRTEDGRRLVGV
jgi:hypothetical protein